MTWWQILILWFVMSALMTPTIGRFLGGLTQEDKTQ